MGNMFILYDCYTVQLRNPMYTQSAWEFNHGEIMQCRVAYAIGLY